MKIKSVIAIFFAMLLGLAVATKVIAKTTIKTDVKIFDTDDHEDEDTSGDEGPVGSDDDSDDDDDDDNDNDNEDWLEDDEDEE